MREEAIILGLNYWPQRTAMFMWRQFDAAAIQDDFARIAESAFSTIRIFLLWEDFQPEPRRISPLMLDRLVQVMELAAECRLAVMPSLFTGHMSGLNWLPPWMLLASRGEGRFPVFSLDKVRENRPKNPYTAAEVLPAQIFFLQELSNALCGHPALFAWDLGNEPSFWSLPPAESAADFWFRAMTETLKERDESVPVTLGIPMDDIELQPRLLVLPPAAHLDYLSVHVYPQQISWARSPLDAPVLAFAASLVRWLSKRPVLLQEFGVPALPELPETRSLEFPEALFLATEEEAARFAEEALAYLGRFAILGGFWWCYGDYHPAIWSWPPLDRRPAERFYGLFRYDGTPKPAVGVFKSAKSVVSRSEAADDWLDISEEEFCRKPLQHLPRLYQRFRECHSLP